MANIKVPVKFEAKADRKALYHKGKQVTLDADGEGSISVTPNETEALLAEVRGAQPGSKVKITLDVKAPAKLEMADFVGKVSTKRTVWASSRFLLVTT